MAICTTSHDPQSPSCPCSGLNNRLSCRNYDFISFNISGLKCFKVGKIENKERFKRELMKYAEWTFVLIIYCLYDIKAMW